MGQCLIWKATVSGMEPIRPDFAGASIAGIIPALLGARSATWVPVPANGAESVVLLVLDGLGWAQIEANRGLLPNISAMQGSAITSVAPSTTATALTSITTGLTPIEHGVLGYRVREEDDVLNILSWRTDQGSRPPEPEAFQRHAAFMGREVPVVTKSEFRTTGFTKAHLGGARLEGWSTVAVLVEQCARLALTDPLVYAYYPGVDAVAHEYGLNDDRYFAELKFADRLVGWILESLPSSTALLITADHGQVEVGRDGWLETGSLAKYIEMQAGEGRFRHLYAKQGAAADLAGAARSEFGDQAWVFTRSELINDGWFGEGRPTPSAGRRIGDVVLAAKDCWAFTDPSLRREAQLISAHGSLTEAEMFVPFLGARGVR